MIALLFEDLLQKFNTSLQIYADKVLAKPNRAEQFDALTARSAQQKLQQRYSAGRKLSNSYSAKTGPWVQFGLILGVFANEKQ